MNQEAAPAQATASACQYFFLSIMDRYLFGLLRWTLGPESRGVRRQTAAQKLRETDNNTHLALLHPQIAQINLKKSV